MDHLHDFTRAIIASYLDAIEDKSLIELLRRDITYKYQYTVCGVVYCNGDFVRVLGNPTHLVHYEGRLSKAVWFDSTETVKHRQDGPAEVTYSPNGIIKTDRWFFNGLEHCTTEAAYKSYSKTGKLRIEIWRKNGITDRDDKNLPKMIIYYECGKVNYEFYNSDRINHAREVTYSIDGDIKNDRIIESTYFRGTPLPTYFRH